MRLVLTFLLLVLAAHPATAGVFNPETFTLKNGMQVVVITNRRAPVVNHMVWYKVGAADEPHGKSGISHFVEHLMFRGTDTLAPGEFSDIVARNGGNQNAFAAQDYTAFFQTVARDRLEDMMRLEADRMRNLKLTDDVVTPERGVIMEERLQVLESNPTRIFGEVLGSMLYPHHPYGTPVIGWMAEMERLTRDDAEAFYRTWYAPNNAILIVSGDMNADELRPLANRTYGKVPRRDVPARIRPRDPPFTGEKRYVMHDARVRNATFSKSWLVDTYATGDDVLDIVALGVLQDILSGHRNSLLPQTLVIERKLATQISFYHDPDGLQRKSASIYAVLTPGTDRDTFEAALQTALDQFMATGPTESDVFRSINRLLDAAVLARDNLSTPTRVFGTSLTTGGTIAHVEQWPTHLRAMTRERIQTVALSLFTSEPTVTGWLLPE